MPLSMVSPADLTLLIGFLASAGVAAAFTWVHVRLSGRLAHFAPADDFHEARVALSGGVGIWLAFLLVMVFARVGTATTWLIVGSSVAMVGVGLWDDLRPLRPQHKLLLQLIVSTGAVAAGLRFDMPGLEVLGVPLSILWLIGMANAFNLIDNMDGLAAGIAALSAIFLGVQAWTLGSLSLAACVVAFAGAYAGFLPFNFKPARIFMGDCGAMGAGYFLGAVSIAGSWRDMSNLLLVVVIPVLILVVPIFNMLFVIVTRRLSGVRVSGGRADHINYRLVAHGLSERRSVVLIYALSAGCGVLALAYNRLGSMMLVALASIVTIAFLYFGVFLYQASVRKFYADFSVEQDAPVDLTKLPFAQYWWRLFQVLTDVILVSSGYFVAYWIRFEGVLPAAQERNFILTLPYLIVIKTAVFSGFGLYGSYWRYVGVRDLLKIVQAVGLSAAAFAAGVVLIRPEFFSRSVFVVDAIVTLMLIGGSRVLLRMLREFILVSRSGDSLIRTIIVGAGDSGELMLRIARQYDQLRLNVVGFVDDDPNKGKVTIYGVRVLGPTDALSRICREQRPELAIIAIPSAPGARIGEIAAICRDADVACKIMSFQLSDVDAGAPPRDVEYRAGVLLAPRGPSD
ncbi:MAG TPA: hypothetical protein VJ793_27365 [Anaerolineae bacterium]|nr:hypothetical protein [Anaerolineae bacterium]